MNGTLSQTPQYAAEIDRNTLTFLGILVVDGNEICCTIDLRCTVDDQIMYTNRLTIQGLWVFSVSRSGHYINMSYMIAIKVW